MSKLDSSCINKNKKISCCFLLFSIILLFLLFANINVASAQDMTESQDCENQAVPNTLEFLRLGLTPSLRMPEGGIASPFLSADSDQQMSSDGSRVAMFRLYNQWTGEHFYTSSISERDTISKKGWKQEGIGWYAPTSKDMKPVYRLYNGYVEGGDHHYTPDENERDACVKAGWTYEGIGWYSVTTSTDEEPDAIDVLRQYNPYAKTGIHNYTTNKQENYYLVAVGWRGEGVGWRGYSVLEPSKIVLNFAYAVVDETRKTYKAAQIRPSAKVTGLTENKDYVVTYGTNISVGVGSVTITGKGRYTGSKTYYFEINQLNIMNANVTLGNSLTYNGKAQTQTVLKVEFQGNTIPTSEYTVSNNTQTNAGTYDVRITGKGNCTGIGLKSFVISPMNIKGAQIALEGSGTFDYDATVHEQKVSNVTVNGLTLTSSDYKIENNKQTDVGTHTLKVTGKGNFTGEASADFVINKAKLTASNLQAENKLYDATTVATFLPDWTLTGVFGTDDVTVTPIGTFGEEALINKISENVPVAITYEISGAKKHCYEMSENSQKESSADIEMSIKITCNTQGHGNPTYNKYIASNSNVEIKAEDYGTEDGLTLEGFYTDANCKETKIETDTIFDAETEIFANWVPATDGDLVKYWLAPSKLITTDNTQDKANVENENYVQAAWNVKKSSAEIDADVEKIKAGNIATIAEYEGYMKNDNYHLYTQWLNENNTGEDKFVEFRILQVGQHEETSDPYTITKDGTTLTFEATHLTPYAVTMQTNGHTNKGGWSKMEIFTSMNDKYHYLFLNLNEGFTGKLKEVYKRSYTGDGSDYSYVNTTTTKCKFWPITQSELVKDVNPPIDGNQYAFYDNFSEENEIQLNAVAPALVKKTRSGGVPKNTTAKGFENCYWTRMPQWEQENNFYYVGADGTCNGGDDSTPVKPDGADSGNKMGLAPCCAF